MVIGLAFVFAGACVRRCARRFLSIEGRVEAALREECGVQGGEVLVALVSGGSDSVAMLHALRSVQDRWEPRLEVEVLHFDHGLRAESASDAAFVAALCERLGVSCRVHAWAGEVAPTQASARAWRRRVAVEAVGARRGRVVLAHHADDQVETAVLRLARGARLEKVFRGMDVSTPPFARPLLAATKDDLVAFLRERGESWVEDASNAEPKYARNRARLDVVPGLRTLSRGDDALRRRVAALARQSRALEAWINAVADDYERRLTRADGLDIADWGAVPEPARLELLARLVDRRGGRAPYAALVDIDGALRTEPTTTWSRSMPGGVELRRAGARIEARRRDEDRLADRRVARRVADLDILLPDDSWTLRAARRPTATDAVGIRDVARGARLELRFRRDGDRFHPAWRERPLKLKDFLRGQRVPLVHRDRVPILVLTAVEDRVIAVFLAENLTHVARPFLHPPPSASVATADDDDLLWIEPPFSTHRDENDDDI
ncbi:hypothetical protein CTAYLR_005733 [Chrysophaeum taylorii]|uniref:tRNA(Ile)-lysidine synthetase n=1 Tax=Chrysophaeum taylorii TaxID=2483200 RepID=A0AAD7UJL5_9STRA|nr:hypothetical protein CTAYLR_005733 [Chrysophaeum taylorii]